MAVYYYLITSVCSFCETVLTSVAYNLKICLGRGRIVVVAGMVRSKSF